MTRQRVARVPSMKRPPAPSSALGRRPLAATSRIPRGAHSGHELSQIRVQASAPRQMQARLAIGPPGDAFEAEAERVARQVTQAPESTPASRVGRAAAGTSATGAPLVQLQATGGRAGREAPSVAHEAVVAPGRALDSGTRAFMEPRFGHDFRQVRVHTDTSADGAAAAVGARAFTVGRDIVFRAGEYAPATPAGRQLLAHELTHVVQQSSAENSPALQRQEEDPPRLPDVPGLVNALSDDIGANLFTYGHHFYRVATLYPDQPDLLEETFGRYALGANVLETGFAFLGADVGTAQALALGTGITFKGVNFLRTGELTIDYQFDLGRDVKLEAAVDLGVSEDFSKVKKVDAGLSVVGHF